MAINLDFGSLLAPPNLEHLAAGLKYTLALTAASWLLAVCLGVVLATLRVTGNRWLDRGVAAWVAYQQNVPMAAFNDVYRSYFEGHLPVRSTVEAKLSQGVDVEIEVTAWSPSEGR